MIPTEYLNIRRQVLDAIQEAVELRLIHGTSSNIAVRDPDSGAIAITPSSIAYKTMTVEDIAIVSPDGKWLSGPHKSSSETPMHTTALRRRPDVNATVHTHGMFCTILAMVDEPLRPVTPPQAEFSPVNIVPFVMPGSGDLANAVVKALGASGRAVLLKNHGMFTCGKDIKAAMAAAIYTEEMATTTYYAKMLGIFNPLSHKAELDMQTLIAANQAV